MTAGRKHCRTTSRSRSVEPFISCKLSELLALTPLDFDQLDDLASRPDGLRLWWHLRRLEWAEQDRTAEL